MSMGRSRGLNLEEFSKLKAMKWLKNFYPTTLIEISGGGDSKESKTNHFRTLPKKPYSFIHQEIASTNAKPTVHSSFLHPYKDS